ncbi:hypothetical protein GXP70_07030 [Paenibacillus lycopersici]|uniref:Nucleotidyltransferase domain-containing protein n=1 Tax=Paenibacillus lycopersici TaxID=2704462 RepID=A0A6C0FRG5_9BACL|nr:hypothetical protein [Paenibacillus lycopersici]QHT59728.1 hypothetical protein GXP70_07030 [Paenibacillus lycopersici]
MTITRETIISHIAASMGSEDSILALWLEGSDGTGSVDEYSDIDLVCYARAGCEDEAMARLDACLKQLGDVDLDYEQPGRPVNNRYKVYHLRQTPESLLIDATIQSESFPVSFIEEDRTVVPVVLVDKAEIVCFRSVDPEELRAQLLGTVAEAKAVFGQKSRAEKYTKRGLFLESLIYYHKYVLNPLVDVLRIVHTPLQADCFLVHATRDFPDEVTARLENLYGVRTVREIADRIALADELFRRAVVDAEAMLSGGAFLNREA